MPETLEFARGRSIGNGWVSGAPPSWIRVQGSGALKAAFRAYDKGGDFSYIIWQVNDTRPDEVRLQVDAPRYNANPALNDLKASMIAALLGSELRQLAESRYHLDHASVRLSGAAIQQNKTTTLFKVVLSSIDADLSPEDKIKAVHDHLHTPIDRVLEQFRNQLNQHFAR